MNHYFTNNNTLESNPKYYEAKILNHDFRFKTDNGVFSKTGVDFGSRLLVESFQLNNISSEILEVGCGYGPIGLPIAKNYDVHVDMIDINDRAVSLANENAVKNGIDNVDIFVSNLYEKITKQYATIISNPPIRAGKDTVFAIYEGAYEHLLPNGTLWVVIQKKQGAPSTIKKLETLFRNVEIITKDKGYYIICATKG